MSDRVDLWDGVRVDEVQLVALQRWCIEHHVVMADLLDDMRCGGADS